MIGQTLTHYRIESKLGEGGMGVVYRALDTHLDRPVAVKLLPPEAVANPERKRRFVQEAKAASALNHPNIIHVYGIDTAAPQGHPVDFIAMEFVEGKTLHDCIGRKGLSVREAMKYAVQIADALAAAHAAGIIHRDIKPGNIMVTGPKRTPRPGEDPRLRARQTQRTRRERQRGLHADGGPAHGRRRDRWDRGLHVARTGRGEESGRAHRRVFLWRGPLRNGDRPARISGRHQDFDAFGDPEQGANAVAQDRRGSAADLERLIAYCLRKDPSERMHSMKDVRLLLEDVGEAEQKPSVPAAAATRRSWLRRMVLVGASLVALAALVLAWLSSRGLDLPSYRLTPFVTEAGQENAPAWSPDGKTLAYAAEVDGVLQIHTRSLDAPAGTRLTSSLFSPATSLSGRRMEAASIMCPMPRPPRPLLFEPELWSVGAAGGIPQLVVRNANAASVSPDGKALVFSRGARGASGLWIASPPEAQPRLYRQAPFPEHGITTGHPQFSPDGSKIGIAIQDQPKPQSLNSGFFPIQRGRQSARLPGCPG